MSGNNSANNRFPLPDEWDIDDVICMVIPVPDDAQYIEIMRGLVDTLTWARSFNQHPTENAAYQVSKSWQRALDSGITFVRCGMPDFRINPDTCLLEVDCGDDNWQPVFTSEHPQGAPTIPYPPDTPQYEDNTAYCISAANLAAALKSGTDTLSHDAAIVGGIAIAIINLVGAFLFFVPYGFLVDIGIAILDVAVGHTIEEFGTDYDAIDWQDVRDGIACFIERDGSITVEGRANILSWMDTVYSGNLAWALTKIIVQNVDADGLTNSARIPQDSISIEDCPVCGAVDYYWYFEGADPEYTMTTGTVGTGGLSGNCALSVPLIEGGTWRRTVRVTTPAPQAGLLIAADFYEYYHDIFASGQAHECALTLFDEFDTVKEQFYVTPTHDGTWVQQVKDGADWVVETTDYFTWICSKNWLSGAPAYEENADGTDTRLDNLHLRFAS